MEQFSLEKFDDAKFKLKSIQLAIEILEEESAKCLNAIDDGAANKEAMGYVVDQHSFAINELKKLDKKYGELMIATI
jgi:hypothetical protein